MENSIEEDITRIKQRIEDVKEYIEYGLPYSEYLDLENSFDNILSDYKRVLKENGELKEKIREQTLLISPYYVKENYIPVQKIKDKIEELNQYYKKEIYPSLSQWRDLTITEHYDEMIELLHEIIGDK